MRTVVVMMMKTIMVGLHGGKLSRGSSWSIIIVTGHAMSQKKTRELVLRRALAELIAWQKRYHELHEFADLFETIEEAAKKLPRSVRK